MRKKTAVEVLHPEISQEIQELEEKTNSVSKMFDSCDIVNHKFIDNIGAIGGIHRKYTTTAYIPKSSDYNERFDIAMNKFNNARKYFVNNCSCQKK